MNSWNPVTHNLWTLMRGLRQLNFDLTEQDFRLALEALRLLGVTRRARVHDVLEVVWCKTPSDVALFDMAFSLWVMLLGRPESPQGLQDTYLSNLASRRRQEGGVIRPSWFSEDRPSEFHTQTNLSLWAGASQREAFEARQLDRLTPEELYDLLQWYRPRRPLVRASYLSRPSLQGRQWNPAETMRRGRQGSEWVSLYYDRRRVEPLELSLLLDVSGSTAGYHRVLLQFAHAMMRHESALRVFAFGTRLTSVTRPFRHLHVDRALAEVSALIPDRGGGTKIAQSLEALWRRERGHGISPRSVLIVVSDGLEEGDGDLVDQWIGRWSRYLRGRVHWWNPLDVRHPEFASSGSSVALARHTIYRTIPNFRALTRAWASLDPMSAL